MLTFEVENDGFRSVVIPTDTAAEVEIEEPGPEDTEAAELLAKVKLDHVPTEAEAKALLTARRQEIRHAVLVEADARQWCEDGTRKVCANLRLERPGDRTQREVELEMTVKVRTNFTTYTPEGVVKQLQQKGLLSPDWLKQALYVKQASATPLAITVDGTVIDVSALTEEKPEVSA